MALRESLAPVDVEHTVGIRHDLHAHPELGYEERRTSEVVQRELAAAGIEFRAGLAGGTGVLGYLPATRPSPKTVALRADMDCLPIQENTGKPYASTVSGQDARVRARRAHRDPDRGRPRTREIGGPAKRRGVRLPAG